MTREELLALIDRAADEGWKKLDLAGKGLTELPEEIGKLTQLETLILGKRDEETYKWIGNELTLLPETIAYLTNLTTLVFSSNQLRQIPESITHLTNLTTLDLSENQLIQIPESITHLTNLTTLVLPFNELTEIPESITHLTNLTTLVLYFNQIAQIPESITHLTNLTTLFLSYNQITRISDEIGHLINLTELDLHSNQLTEIPESITHLIDLRTLKLSDNQLTQIPEAFTQLISLRTLHLSNNRLTQIPEAITHLTNLTTLDLDNNQIRQIPESITRLTHLRELYLGGNQLMQIPEAITHLTRLTSLVLSDNQITQIPEAISHLTHLRTLVLSDNQIVQIPETISHLANLSELYLENNQIVQIPETISHLTNLTELYLGDNNIEEFPGWLENLPDLEILELCGNSLPISPEVLDSPDSVEDVFNYYRQLHSGEVRPLNEAKLLLVGQGSVGKTSLINRLIYNRYNRNQPQTDGLNIETWGVHVNSKDVRLNVWDFGGQEIYHATHQFFLTKRSLYLLVCNCRTSEDENRLEYWLKLIESFGGQSPVIIVGNKKDEQPLDINRKALLEKYPNIQAILETSCETNDGIDDLRAAITHEVGSLHDVYNLLPLSWFEVKEHLETLDQDFIPYSKYACICEAKTITEDHNQEQLITLLHNLGLVLNFRDHPILQNTNVLNPDWVTAGIYALLSDETLKTKTKGILTYADLDRILDPQRYPATRHHYLTELMKEFQLCFQLPDSNPPIFLIPGLLPKDEPQDTQLRGDTLEFQYHYRILPDSIMSRFIVLSHDKIHKQTYWRSGVMLAYTEGSETYNIARIKADPEDKKIFISISGQASTRRSFLLIIRDIFNKIHSTFANPEVSEWVPVPGHPNHSPLDYQELLGLETMGERTVTIGKLKLKLDLRQLLDGYESIEARQRRQRSGYDLDEIDLPDTRMRDRFNIINNIYNTNQQGDHKSMTEITNNNQGANIGNFVNEAKDNAQVTASNFSQTSGINTAELFQLIATMRQTAAQFPQEIQDDIIVDLDDVEEEIKKPENQRNLARLKKRLIALATTGSMIAAPIAGVTDFANTAIDLGTKLGIELQLPPAP